MQDMSKVSTPPENKRSLPSRGLKSSSKIWTKEKVERDCELWGFPKSMWVIENKIYDLSSYAKSHPGGSQWIELTQGQDLTEHFVSHHLNEDKARAVLQKYYVRDVQKPQPPRFTFEEDGLYRRVKRRVLQKYKPEDLQNWNKSVIDGLILLFIWLTLFISSGIFHSYILAILCGISIFPVLGVAHNFIHMRWHPFRYLWMITCFTHEQWQRMHCLSHHSFPNTLLDYEIQALEPVAYYLRVLPKNTILKRIILQCLFLTPAINIILKLIVVPLTQIKQPQWFYLFPLLQLPALYFLTQEWDLAWKFFMVIHASGAFTFMKLTFLGHRTGQEWTEGYEEVRDFAQHQIVSSSDVQTNDLCGFFSYICYAGFNFHAVHHIFPTIDNHYLPVVDKILTNEAASMKIHKNILTNVLTGLYEVQSNFLNRKIWRRRE